MNQFSENVGFQIKKTQPKWWCNVCESWKWPDGYWNSEKKFAMFETRSHKVVKKKFTTILRFCYRILVSFQKDLFHLDSTLLKENCTFTCHLPCLINNSKYGVSGFSLIKFFKGLSMVFLGWPSIKH